MKTFLLFLLTILVVAAVPAALETCQLQKVLLKEIIEGVKDMREKKGLVENVITPDNCTHENFCKAEMVLSAFTTLKEENWLPRRLIAYTRNTSCNIMGSAEQVPFRQLLENIKHCAQKLYRHPCH